MSSIENFTEAQIDYLKRKHSVDISACLLPVRDGLIEDTEMVWWKAEDYPEKVSAYTHWGNIREYPHLYSIERPKFLLKYLEN
jgi:hypothetical protein